MSKVHFSAPAARLDGPLRAVDELLLSLFEDVLNASLLTAATASIAISIASCEVTALPLTALVCCLPQNPLARPEVVDRLRASSDGESVILCLQDFTAAVTSARELSQLVSLSGRRGRDSLPTGVSFLAADWRRVAVRALTLVDRLETMLATKLPEPFPTRAALAVDLLAAVCRGEAPCVDESGRLTLPAPFERRSAPRAQSGQYAHFLMRDGVQRALVLDVSRQGVGVLGLCNIGRGDRLTLLAGPGLEATGEIVWLDERQAGVKFDQPLLPAILSQLAQ